LRDLCRAFFHHLGNQSSNGVTVVECSKAIARDVSKILGPVATMPAKPLSTEYFVTDEVGQFNQLAAIFLGDRAVQAVRIESLY
jgi:hypothetical protein